MDGRSVGQGCAAESAAAASAQERRPASVEAMLAEAASLAADLVGGFVEQNLFAETDG